MSSQAFLSLEFPSIYLLLPPCISFLLASIFGLFLVFTKKPSSTKPRPPLPPGPTPWPFIGNLPEIWRNKPVFRWIHSLMDQYNTDIACIRVANTHIISVKSPEIACQILKKQDCVFATRPLTMGTEYCGRGYLTIAVVPLGDQWKKMRKVITSHIINPGTFRWMLDRRTEEADNLIQVINNQCVKTGTGSSLVDLRLTTRQYCGNVIRKMMFNFRHFGQGSADGGPGCEEVEHVESLFTVLNHLYAFALSDYVPWLRPLDLEGHEKIVREAMRTVSSYNDPIVDERIRQWKEGERKEAEDLLDMFIQAKDANGDPSLTSEEIKAQVTELMLATVDNPSNAIEWAMAEMINRPEVLRKATEEIDRVVGRDRLVQESDLPNLNYIKSCAREAFRMHPIAPFNLPHVSTVDTVVAGYFIPKGSHVLISRQGLGKNPDVWDNPNTFDPERHIKSGTVDLNAPELKMLTFSTGRRGCMGVSVGSTMTWMLLARLVQGFTWTVPGGDAGKVEILESENDMLMAKPLHLRATPRLAPGLYPN